MRAPAKRLSGLFRSPGSNPGLPATPISYDLFLYREGKPNRCIDCPHLWHPQGGKTLMNESLRDGGDYVGIDHALAGQAVVRSE